MKSGLKVSREVILSFVEGYRKANEVIMAEKRKWLSHLSSQDSLRIYDNLCNFWEQNSHKEGIEKLERQKISFLLKKRSMFNHVSGYKQGAK
ncbi:MAG: hypothetical protein AB1422_12205 [bacterium]